MVCKVERTKYKQLVEHAREKERGGTWALECRCWSLGQKAAGERVSTLSRDGKRAGDSSNVHADCERMKWGVSTVHARETRVKEG
jgi:hypothetical protein